MIETTDGIASVVEQLSERVLELERRVATLEGQPEKTSVVQPVTERAAIERLEPSAAPEGQLENASTAQPVSVGTALQRARPPATWREFPSVQTPVGAVAVVGKAVLGIAGAYLLRAIAESGAVPKLPVLIFAIVYAGLWMVWAVRTHGANHFASATYAITSAMILSPLLWESTVRFQVLSPVFTAVVLVAFVVLPLVLSSRSDLQVILWVATSAMVFMALALSFATHELVPLTAALLAVALATEMSACLGHPPSMRALPAIAADFAVWQLIMVMTSARGVPEGYHPAAPGVVTSLWIVLLAIYACSIGMRTLVLRQQITILEIGQGVLVFAIAVFGALRTANGSVAPELGVVFLLLAAVCYWGALSRFVEESQTRNRRAFATWAAALLLTGSFLSLSSTLQVPFLCLAAVASTFVYTRTGKMTLGLHASVFLAGAAAVSSLTNFVVDAMSGAVPRAPGWGVWSVATSAAVCYAVGSRGPLDEGRRRLLWVVPAVLVGFAGAALAVAAIVGLAGGRLELAASRLSVVRTIVNCALALALGYLGSRWKRVELRWVGYAAVAFGTLKLLFEDLRFGNAASLVVSLLFYGMVLILLPRLTQRGRSAVQGATG